MKKKTYATNADPKCPFSNEELVYYDQGIWECPDQENCGYRENNNLTICQGNGKSCGEVIVSQTNDFSKITDTNCPRCLRKMGRCVECGGTVTTIDNIETCTHCGLVVADDSEVRALQRISSTRRKPKLSNKDPTQFNEN